VLKFSVLMSTYAKETPCNLEKSLCSILVNQSLKPDEFILVCDGPLTDPLYKVIEEYENRFNGCLKVFRRPVNEGLGKALSYGLSKCSYGLVARADSDDICMQDRFLKQVQYMSDHPEIAVLGADIQEFSESELNPISYKRMPQTYESIRKMAKHRNPVNHTTVVFRKSIVEAVGSYEHLPYVEDYYLWVRVLAAGHLINNLNEPLVSVRTGNGMLERRGNALQIKSWKTLNEFMLSHHMISRCDMIFNMLIINVFVYMPSRIKSICYRRVLRKQNICNARS